MEFLDFLINATSLYLVSAGGVALPAIGIASLFAMVIPEPKISVDDGKFKKAGKFALKILHKLACNIGKAKNKNEKTNTK